MAETRPTRAKAADGAGESADAKEKRETEEREAAEKETAEREAAEQKVAADAQAEAGREEHTVEALIEGSRVFFGCSPHIAAGALNGKAEKYTAAEAQDLIDAFLAVEYTP